MPVVLVTDALLYLLLVLVAVFAWYTRRHEHLRRPWRRVLDSRLAVASSVLLAAYAAIGVLDSLHFHPRLADGSRSGTVMSVLDLVLEPLRAHDEKTYSAPLATHAYVRETVELADGRLARVYPRLAFGGAHLADPERGHWPDVAARAVRGAAAGLAVWGVVALAVAARRRRAGEGLRAALSGEEARTARVALATFAVLAVVSGTIAGLATGYHVLGTDKVGQDVLYQALKSVRTGLLIGTLTTLVMLPFAIALGVAAGYFGGRVDDAIQYLYTTLNSIPGVLLIAAAVLMLQVYMANHAEAFESLTVRADMRLLFLCLILGVTSWTGLCRLLRGETLKLREVAYVEASRALGASALRIMTRHVVPNVTHIVLITVVLDFSGLVLAEAVLSYINIGVDPTMMSWGNMINAARLELAREPVVWWPLAAAFVFMLGLVLPANLFADAVRDAFDPRVGTLRR